MAQWWSPGHLSQWGRLPQRTSIKGRRASAQKPDPAAGHAAGFGLCDEACDFTEQLLGALQVVANPPWHLVSRAVANGQNASHCLQFRSCFKSHGHYVFGVKASIAVAHKPGLTKVIVQPARTALNNWQAQMAPRFVESIA